MANMRPLKLLILILSITLLSAGCSNKKTVLNKEELAEQQVEELYNKAKKALDRGNYSFAVQYYKALETSFPFGSYTEQAKLDVIYAYNILGDTERAVSAANNFIELYPTHQNIDYAYYMKGVSSFEKRQSKVDRFIKGSKQAVRDQKPLSDSLDAFNELLKRYPQSVYAKDSKQRIIYLRNRLANRELAIAQYYFDNKTYVATVNRCKHIIYKYETTPAVEGALLLMEKTYLEMGMTDLAKSTHKVLIENFPNYQQEPFSKKKKGFFNRLF